MNSGPLDDAKVVMLDECVNDAPQPETVIVVLGTDWRHNDNLAIDPLGKCFVVSPSDKLLLAHAPAGVRFAVPPVFSSFRSRCNR